MLKLKKDEWFSNIRTDVLAGLVVGLALIPESIAFSAIAGVDPQVGLYASFCIAVSISFLGGRPAMISAATGAMALLMITLVKEHGLQYLLAATVLTGIIQVIAGYFQVAKLMRFVSQAVVYGFLNALAILIFFAQLPEMAKMDSLGYLFMALGLAIIYLFPFIPKIGKAVPSPLICIVVLSLLALGLGADMRTVSDLGQFPDTLPIFLIPDIPINFETLQIIFPYAITLATVGLLETMMTTTVINEVTGTEGDRHQECRGQGYANIISGFMGGMAGCAMIGQSIINVSSGARTRLSTLVAGVFLLCLVVFFKDWLAYVPMAALVAIMVMVSFTTFQWGSVKQFRKHTVSFNSVMIAVVIVVLMTHNLALGVFIGVLLSALFMINQLESSVQVKAERLDHTCYYTIYGQIFFSSADKFYQFFDFQNGLEHVVLDLTHAHIWDITSVNMLNAVVQKFEAQNTQVEVIGLNEASSTLIDRVRT
ncbi:MULTISPECIES: SulP family inorganic anion transporter [Acinetobacter]|uniref:STAS domain-containing protein n=1 Tax=Acinetobacter chengduensis TaxID=2420890 RepID=A0ABX9TW12_9GAMM|nr:MULTISPECIES: SulP family inorganic anion transporter [Acinetobacter]MBI1450560.1 SulP family inorganic anion transporter [Acinetobacter sp. FL51]RKG39887.1 SulP family inorganic anion transporter [Acinetobacter sp. WCHAc060007]RLL22045.1 STAS domain-containing protein [Acinetobacter chengduensis]